LPLQAYLDIVAATNMKQRTRKLCEYTEAERRNFAVIGTPNLAEYQQGFFVRGGDGLADLEPIAHLYKTQVYALAAHLGVPAAIRAQLPSTDTYGLQQSQEEFYYALPYTDLDLVLWAQNHEVPAAAIAATMGWTADQVDRVLRDLAGKARMAERLHRSPLLAALPGQR
jgi:NAD+ synthase